MSKKTAKQKQPGHRSETLITILVALLILAAFITVVIVLANRNETRSGGEDGPVDAIEEDTAEPTEEKPLITIPYDIPGFTLLQEAEVGMIDDTELELLGVGRYSGAYFEDLSDDEVEDVYAIVVRNNGADWVDLAAFTMLCGGKTAVFELSALPNDSAVLLLESNRMTWNEGDYCYNAHVVITENPLPRVFDFEEDFSISSGDGVINITNNSDTTFEDDVLIDYKNFDYGLYLGGLTYRVRFAGIEPGEIRQSIEPHYSIARSVILYMSYDG